MAGRTVSALIIATKMAAMPPSAIDLRKTSGKISRLARDRITSRPDTRIVLPAVASVRATACLVDGADRSSCRNRLISSSE